MGKGQSSIEYLVTYGWMILAAGIAGSLVFANIGEEGGSDIEVEDSPGTFPGVSEVMLTEEDRVAVELNNPRERSATIEEIEFLRNGSVVYSSDWSGVVNGESTVGLEAANYRTSQETKKYTARVRYGPNLVSETSFSGKISIVELVARFNVTPKVIEQGEEVRFDATESKRSDIIEEYNWRFGESDTAGGVIVNHTFEEAGIYPVELSVTDSDGNIARETKLVTVGQVIFNSGGFIREIKASDFASSCIGDACSNSTAEKERPIDIGGGSIGGTLLTNEISTGQELCLTSTDSMGSEAGCKNETTDTGDYLSINNRTLIGSLHVRTLKPADSLCVGESCS
jgi:PKD repeat protein